MARLGEQLIAAGVVSADKVEQALRAAVVWGGRLGTNLIELGCIDLDELSRALGQRHGMAAALNRHFERADPELQALLPVELAKQFSVVPIVRLSPERIAVVALDPLGADARTALASVYGVDANSGIVASVAAEMRVLYHLERVYKLPRPARFLRSKGGGNVTPFPAFDLSFELDVEVEPEIVEELAPIDVDISIADSQQIPQVDAAEGAALLDQAIKTTPDVAPEIGGRERRTYLRTLADDVPPPAAKPAAKPAIVQIPPKVEKPKTAPVPTIEIDEPAPTTPAPATTTKPATPTKPDPAPPTKPVLDAPTMQAPSFDAPTVSAPAATAAALRALDSPTTSTLARLQIRRVAVNTTDAKPIVPTNFVDSTRAIKRGPNRDRVAELVIETLDKFVPSCNAALMLVIRGGVAIGWKHFSRASDGNPEVAVPLDQEGMVPDAIGRKAPCRSAAEDLAALDGLLLRAVGNGEDSELVVVPIMIADQVMCVLAAATAPSAEIAPLEAIASAAGTAFARLIRDASR
jgi:hypothetical protein